MTCTTAVHIDDDDDDDMATLVRKIKARCDNNDCVHLRHLFSAPIDVLQTDFRCRQ